MSFCEKKTVIDEGDTVIVYFTANKMYAVKATAQTLSKKGEMVDNVLQVTPYGALRARDLIGKRYGSRVGLSAGWGYALQPSPELWTLTLPHRTQILYAPDISMIVLQLELCPGSIVLESGTGSGSLSHAIARAVRPSGHLHTFDFHKLRCEQAESEFAEHGLGSNISVSCRDICKEGYPEELFGKANAVFLDLPSPWRAVPHAINTFGPAGGRICAFSPCIEQVQRTCICLAEHDFIDIHTMEILRTQYTVQTRTLPVVKLDFLKQVKSLENTEKQEKEQVKVLTSIPPASLPGHTGYLTFATFLPVWARE